MFELLKKVPGWIQEYGPTAELIIEGLTQAAQMLASEGKTTAFPIPSLSHLRDAIDLHMLKGLLTRKMGESGLITQSDASAMLETDITNLSKASAGPEAGGQILAGIANWLKTNGPALATSIATMIQTLMPAIIAMLAAFGA